MTEPTKPDAVFPVIGTPKEPTPEMIARGAHGNGSWELTDGSVAQAYAERHQMRKELQDEREQFFHDKAKDGLADAIELHHRIIKRGAIVMDKIEREDPDERILPSDLTVLKMAQNSAKELTDRAAGKAKQTSETKSTTTSFDFLISGEIQ